MKRYLFRLPTHLRQMLEHEGELDVNGQYSQTHLEYYMTTLIEKLANASYGLGYSLVVAISSPCTSSSTRWVGPITTIERAVILGHKKIYWLIINTARDGLYPRPDIINKALKFLVREGRSDWLSKYVRVYYNFFQALPWSKKVKMTARALSLTDGELLECLLQIGAIVTYEALILAFHGSDVSSDPFRDQIRTVLQQAQKKYPGSIRVVLKGNFPSSDSMNDT